VHRISGLGSQAVAYVGERFVTLTAYAGNAVVLVTMQWTGHPDQALELPDTTAVARDVLGALPRSAS
jgi:hypothetical protein